MRRKVARRFNAESTSPMTRVPRGTADLKKGGCQCAVTQGVPLAVSRAFISRAFGTRPASSRSPGIETPGDCQASLRDEGNLSRSLYRDLYLAAHNADSPAGVSPAMENDDEPS